MDELDPQVLVEAAAGLGVRLAPSTAARLTPRVNELIAAVRLLDRVADYLPEVRYPRTPGYRPEAEEDPLHAWYRKTEIHGSGDGPLAGWRVALKDNICLAGVPMMNGASYFEGYVPEIDATVVTRLLDAGAMVAGKANCEYLCVSGESYTNSTGPTHNPRRHGYSAGGSSSGATALVVVGEVRMAVGGDQAGSIRIPASWCGAYGMKPTWGLVPCTGVFGLERTIDHIGPITATVADNALALQVLAGSDGLDPRQGGVRTGSYREAVERPVRGLRIGLLTEGFGTANADRRVEEKVRAAVERLRAQGAEVTEVSVPFHRVGWTLWTSIALQGQLETVFLGDTLGSGWKGLYLDSMARHQAAWRRNPDELPERIRTTMTAGQILRTSFGGRYYHKAQNLVRRLKAAYDDALGGVDVLALPTVPFTAGPIPEEALAAGTATTAASTAVAGEGQAGRVDVSPPPGPLSKQIVNTSPFDCTGHPSMSVPCGTVDGLPVGLMLVSAFFDEESIYRAAAAVEAAGDWLEW